MIWNTVISLLGFISGLLMCAKIGGILRKPHNCPEADIGIEPEI